MDMDLSVFASLLLAASGFASSFKVKRSGFGITTSCVNVMLISGLLASSGASALLSCPNGCICNDETLVVLCDLSDLDVLPITINPGTERLIIHHANIMTIDSSIQFYLSLEHLDLSQNCLTSIPDRSFIAQSKLQQLYLSFNKISSVNAATFQGLNALTILNLKRNLIEELNSGIFTNLSRLGELDLGQNRISRIDPNAFTGLTSLTILNLVDNQLTSVPTASFNPLGSLTELYLGLNAFSSLPDNTFAGLNKLIVLDINTANIFNISENAFENLQELKSLNLLGNRLSVAPTKQIIGLTKLEQLYIGHNDFQEEDNEVLQGFKDLKVFYNAT